MTNFVKQAHGPRNAPGRWIILLCLALALALAVAHVAHQPATGVEKSNAARQELAMIAVRLEQCTTESSINRSAQHSAETSPEHKQQLQTREAVLTAQIAALQAREKALRDAL